MGKEGLDSLSHLLEAAHDVDALPINHNSSMGHPFFLLSFCAFGRTRRERNLREEKYKIEIIITIFFSLLFIIFFTADCDGDGDGGVLI